MGWVFALWALTSSICAFAMYFDKRRAMSERWRVPEATLLGWAFLGGAAGGKLAQRLFRHKTRKQPFASKLNAMVVWNLVLYVFLLVPGARDVLWLFIQGLGESLS